MEGLNLDNILDEEGMSLFNEDVLTEKPSEETESDDVENKKEETTEVDTSALFGEGEPESVGSGSEDKEDYTPDKSGGSPNNNIFPSIAEAFVEEGILPDLDEEDIKNIKNAEDFRKVISDYLDSELTEQQRRVKEALDNNVEPNVIRQYENAINYLDNIDEESLRMENEMAEDLRKRLIFQDYMNRGFDKERAGREVEKAVQNGSDIEDAIDALKSNKNYYSNAYNNLLAQAKADREAENNRIKERANKLKSDILDTKNKFFGEIDVDKSTRQRIYDNITKPIYRDKETGETYTAVQKYELEHSDEFLAKIGLIYTLTDGFKNLDGLVKGKVKKEVRKGFRDLENKINSTARDQYGNLKFSSGVSDEDSYLGKGIKLNL